ncbi:MULTISPECIES: transcription termination factor NusA [Facklamia]|uniref:transcription termination factor NusA n=1 Tax=Facklamia TaxID=66831 RepID=UPI000353F967|nr:MULTISPECIES: transcription termination factor NusA [Facklamia]EPH12791.1 transcription termination factor NusA [Facklamia hominis ACS-120-V-Sch10]OFL65135.1 transcription termination/antitermination protein NusA [Facklamia sp. HMSC062C11]PKY93117.1 transcription termination/antitermination protein NusA [Facklamia hominis]RYC98895.1 transcription termination/antitermination protein NusA [Facklamia hominis]
MSKELVAAMQLLEEEKGIKPEVIKEALESALVLAYKKNYDQAQNVEVEFNDKTGDIKVYSVKEVVETNYDSTQEVSLEEALKINRAYEIGDKIKFEVTPKDFGRIATQTAKHVVLQRIREAERDIIYNEYIDYQDEILTGTVERKDSRNVYVSLNRVEAMMPLSEQIPNEDLAIDQRVKVYVSKVDKTSKGPQIIVSRAHPDFLRRLFEQEVPEIYDGIVEVMSIAREAGDRSKVAVFSRDANIDPIGTCVGPRGARVQAIVNELNGENMDIVQYSEDPETFIKNAMNPAEVLNVHFMEEEERTCIVVVPDYQLSLAIGKKGQNARLAARLTGYKIDIKSQDSYQAYLEEEAERQAQALEEAEEQVAIDDQLAANVEDEMLEINEEQEALEDLRQTQEEAEAIYDPEDVEAQIAELEEDHESDYQDLLDDADTVSDVDA